MKYKFFCTHNGVETEVFTYNFSSAKFVYEKKGVYFTIKLNAKLIFGNDPGRPNYTYFKTIEDGVNRCLEISLKIKRSCDGGLTYVDYWFGYFSVNDGKFDLDKCLYQVEPKVNDVYRCLNESEGVERNILNVSGSITTTTLQGSIVTLTCNRTVLCTIANASPYYCGVGSVPGDQGWCMYQDIVTPLGVGGQCMQVTTWRREEILTACSGGACVFPSGSGWKFITDNCGTTGNCLYARCPVTVTSITYTHNRLLYAVILYFINQNCPLITGLVSDFFEWNPPGTATGYVAGNNYVTGTTNRVNHLTIAQKSDIMDPVATNPATVGNTTFKKLTEWMQIMFNVYWFVEAGKVRFEHISYFSHAVGLDLTTPTYAKYIAGTRKYEYLKLKMPMYEKFRWMEANTRDFVGMDIVYNSLCVNQNSSENEVVYSVDQVTTDLFLIQGHPEDISKEGFVIISNSFNGSVYTVNSEAGLISGVVYQNGHLSWANLHYNYHRHERVLLNGTMNGISQTFLSAILTKKQTQFQFPLCCLAFNPDDLIATGLGNGRVERAELDAHDGFLTVELLL